MEWNLSFDKIGNCKRLLVGTFMNRWRFIFKMEIFLIYFYF